MKVISNTLPNGNDYLILLPNGAITPRVVFLRRSELVLFKLLD